jgi:2-C-methyl-D-erythritol 4-phosphate cytidylyltransferase/2-C-methyl-D-erythritol 2,4-cyclodiphosphate synthase
MTAACKGHSDADVGMHTVTDAIYGALGGWAISAAISRPAIRNGRAPRHIFLTHAVDHGGRGGFAHHPCRPDADLRAPQDRPACRAMRRQLAEASWGSRSGRVSVKATTTERLGFTGREEGIAALATATLVRA